MTRQRKTIDIGARLTPPVPKDWKPEDELTELKAKWNENSHYLPISIDDIADEAFKLGQDDRQKEFDKTLVKVFKKKIKGATVEELDQAKLFIDAVEQAKSEETQRIKTLIEDEIKREKVYFTDIRNRELKFILSKIDEATER